VPFDDVCEGSSTSEAKHGAWRVDCHDNAMDAPSGPARVVLTYDDLDLAMSFAALLRLELPRDVDVVVTHDGLEALDEMSTAPQPVAIVLDLGMPGMTGLETASAIRSSSPSARDTVLVAVSADEILLDCARRSGYFRMVQREPIDFEALLRLLKSLQGLQCATCAVGGQEPH
jgi:CheY-like chemotaxis protein